MVFISYIFRIATILFLDLSLRYPCPAIPQGLVLDSLKSNDTIFRATAELNFNLVCLPSIQFDIIAFQTVKDSGRIAVYFNFSDYVPSTPCFTRSLSSCWFSAKKCRMAAVRLWNVDKAQRVPVFLTAIFMRSITRAVRNTGTHWAVPINLQ